MSGDNPPSEWLCDCGHWVPIGYSTHQHVKIKEPSLADVIERRRMVEAGLTPGMDLTETADITRVLRTREHKTR